MWVIGDYSVSLLPYFAIVSIGIILLLPITLFRKWYFERRRLKTNLITFEYEPPANLTPAEMQYLFGGIDRDRIVAATLIDLTQRGILFIRKHEGKKLVYRGPNDPSNLRTFERMLVAKTEQHNGIPATVLMTQPITHIDFGMEDTPELTSFSEHILESLRDRRLVKNKGVNEFFKESIRIAILLHISLIWWPIILFWLLYVLGAGSSDFSSVFDFIKVSFVASVLSTIPSLVLGVYIAKMRSKTRGRRWMSDRKLLRLWPQIIGFRHFVKLVEKNKLHFETEKLQETTSKNMLPYAVALNFVKNWRDIVS